MRIVMNHLTRMRSPRICVAGIDQATGRHVRPTTPAYDPITRELLAGQGGPFGLGAIVDIGDATPEPSIPELEDHRFATSDARTVGQLDADAYLQLLTEVGQESLDAIFGPDIRRPRGANFAVDVGMGTASLGVLHPQRPPAISVAYERPALKLDGFGRPAYVPITDLRFFEDDQRTVKVDGVEDANQRMRRGVNVTVMVGLARATTAPDDDRDRHWLQVNGICLEDRPLGDEP